MAHGLSGIHQNHNRLLFLEVMLHLLAASLVFSRLPIIPDTRLHIGFVAVLGGAIVLRVLASLFSTSDSSLTGSYGKSAGLAQVVTTLFLGLAWGLQLPLLTSLDALESRFLSTLPVATSISALAIFTGSALDNPARSQPAIAQSYAIEG